MLLGGEGAVREGFKEKRELELILKSFRDTR